MSEHECEGQGRTGREGHTEVNGVRRIEESHVAAAAGIGMDLQHSAEEQRRYAHELERGERLWCVRCVSSNASRVPPAGRVNDWIELDSCRLSGGLVKCCYDPRSTGS
jgi:hypothetical protein